MTEKKIVDAKVEVAVQQVVTAKASFETDAPFYHVSKDKEPESRFECRSNHRKLTDEDYQVVLTMELNAVTDGKTIFSINVQQVGIFKLKGIEGESLQHVLNVFCPATLLPYAREVINGLVIKGGFPAFYMGPMDFESAYQKRLLEKNTVH